MDVLGGGIGFEFLAVAAGRVAVAGVELHSPLHLLEVVLPLVDTADDDHDADDD